jgi:hypothetical protein
VKGARKTKTKEKALKLARPVVTRAAEKKNGTGSSA